MFVVCLGCGKGCVVQPKLSSVEVKQIASHLNVPTRIIVPSDWANSSLELDSNSTSNQPCGASCYRVNFVCGWNEAIQEYDSGIELAFRKMTSFELRANRDGRNACQKVLQELENKFGTWKLKGSIRENRQPFLPAYSIGNSGRTNR